MRVLLTRPDEQGERTAERLCGLGHEPLLAPVLAIGPSGEPPPDGPFDALVLTSANAAPYLATVRRGSTPVFAVGERTAATARAAGAREVRVGPGDAAALARAIAGAVPAGSALLLVAGRERKAEPENSLRSAGFRVTVWTAYRADAADRLPRAAADALRADRLDAALHYSRRSAATLLRLAAGAGLLPPLLALPHLCLSADVAEPLRAAGGPRLVLADAPHEDALLRSLAALSPDRSL